MFYMVAISQALGMFPGMWETERIVDLEYLCIRPMRRTLLCTFVDSRKYGIHLRLPY